MVKDISTPYYLLDQERLIQNMQFMKQFANLSKTRLLLALKCFAVPFVFPDMKQFLYGTTSSSLYEMRLGKTAFGGETHAYNVAFRDDEIDEVLEYADKIIFNSTSQLHRFKEVAMRRCCPIGLRINPGVSFSPYSLADPARPYSRLGVTDREDLCSVLPQISGLMFHFNCENDDFCQLQASLKKIEEEYAFALLAVDWISLGGGIKFISPHYPWENLANYLKEWADRYHIQIYLEPGAATMAGVGSLEVSVLDIIKRQEQKIAIVDASIEAHMLDYLLYEEPIAIKGTVEKGYSYQIAGNTCLAGDIFGTFSFPQELAVGDQLSIQEAAAYTIVKKNWFNGVKMPAIARRKLNGQVEMLRRFTYTDYLHSLS